MPRVGPCPPLPPSPPLRPVGLLLGHCPATLALLWLCLNHYCTLGGGLKTVMLVPPPPANRPIYLFDCQVYLLIIAPVSNSWNKYFYCLLFYCNVPWYFRVVNFYFSRFTIGSLVCSQRSADFRTREEVSPRSYGRGPA